MCAGRFTPVLALDSRMKAELGSLIHKSDQIQSIPQDILPGLISGSGCSNTVLKEVLLNCPSGDDHNPSGELPTVNK